MKALITVAGGKYDATINACYAIIKRRQWVPDQVKIYFSDRQHHRDCADRAKEAISHILQQYGPSEAIALETVPFDEYKLDTLCERLVADLTEFSDRKAETAMDITCGKKLISGIMLKTGTEHKDKLKHIFYVYVTKKAYFDRWFPLRPMPSQDVMDLLTL